jgi:hypothetical protein
MEDYREPRAWWTRLNREAFDPMFETRDEAIIYYGPGIKLMRVYEQLDECTVE